MQWHFQEFDWNPDRRAPFSFLSPNFESIDDSIVCTALLVDLYHIKAEIWFILPMLQNSWVKKQGKNPCLDRCWISYILIYFTFIAYQGILMDRLDNLFPKAKAWFLMLIQI